MKFAKSFLRYEGWDRTISETIIGHRRWSIDYEVIFEHEGAFYRTRFSRGATEGQDERPYDYESDEIECPEVRPVERLATVYEEV